MGRDEYSSGVSGGALKLKGVAAGGIKKKKKKKSKDPSSESTSKEITKRASDDSRSASPTRKRRDSRSRSRSRSPSNNEKKEKEEKPAKRLTDAERRFEEMRKKRLDDRLRKEGATTHKEKVEQFNRYLANLSEHHDMPRIGPG